MNELSILEGPALIVAALIIIGRCLKAWGAFPDKLIPTALAVLGAVAYSFMAGWTPTNFLIGITLGGTAVWGNQQWRQLAANGNGNAPAVTVKLMLVGLACLPLMGCTTALKCGNIVSVKQRTFGITLGSNPATDIPEVKLGFVTTVFQVIPVSTNGPSNAPRYFDTFKLGQGINPFSTEIIENTGAGDVMIGTNATGSAIVPKSPVPPASPAPVQRK